MKFNDSDYQPIPDGYAQFIEEANNPTPLEDELTIESAGLLEEPSYKVIRFYKDYSRDSKVILTGLTLEEAQAHCRRTDTRNDEWFDGYEEE